MKPAEVNKQDQLGSGVNQFDARHSSDTARRSANLNSLRFTIYGVLLSVAFFGPLTNFLRFAFAEDRNSYLVLIPAISAYLIWSQRRALHQSPASLPFALLFGAVGGFAAWQSRSLVTANPADQLSLLVLAYLAFLMAGAFFFFGFKSLRPIAFPAAFLVFAIPMPTAFANAIEIFLQHASAEAASWMLSLTGIPFFRENLQFKMPGVSIRVAQECSGYNASFTLFILSALAGHLCLRTTWKKWLLTLVVIPLAVLRNAFRITTLSFLSVKFDPAWLDSPLHHRGGPLFFALSLIPFFLLLLLLRKSDAVKAVNHQNPLAK